MRSMHVHGAIDCPAWANIVCFFRYSLSLSSRTSNVLFSNVQDTSWSCKSIEASSWTEKRYSVEVSSGEARASLTTIGAPPYTLSYDDRFYGESTIYAGFGSFNSTMPISRRVSTETTIHHVPTSVSMSPEVLTPCLPFSNSFLTCVLAHR